MKTDNYTMHNIIRFKMIWFLFILLSCCFFSRGQNTESYPNEINCILNNYITEFSDWEEIAGHNFDSYINPWGWLLEDKIIEQNQIISIRQFRISGSEYRRDCFWIKIWKMVSSADGERLLAYCKESVAGGYDFYLYKMPKSFFVVEDYFVWINACSFATRFNVDNEFRKIIDMCFE
ncbi:MAG: hypothetical protein LBC70_01385 [Chitinispirillales bacterium]|jgi:hypothetical protein|nr:hypothetical protein [Chitinispirillales bacterium]